METNKTMFILKFKPHQGWGEKMAILCDSSAFGQFTGGFPTVSLFLLVLMLIKKEHKQTTQFLTQCTGGGQGVELMYPKSLTQTNYF